MRIPLLEGRAFGPADRDGAERVVIVSRALAERLWPGEWAVGKRIYWGGTTGRTRTVVGVAGDIRDAQLEAEPPPMLFLPHAQLELPAMTIVARTSDDLPRVAQALRDVVRVMDSTLPAPSIQEIAANRSELAAGPRFNLYLLGAFAAIALVLAVTGVYAMLSFAVAERRREMAVRLALGASASRIARLVLRNGLTLTIAGIAAGTAASLASTRLLASLLYGVEPTDPLTFAAAASFLMLAALLACYLPARQAARLEAITVLRE
jgi:hypothetical protein